MISEGGTEYGHMVTMARASSPWGPFEPCPRNPILTHRDTPLSQPIQATGHADLVEDGEGNWWMVFLGIRPQGGYYWHHLGRETFLAPVRWDAQGWPVVNEGKPIALDMQVRGLPAHPTAAAPVRDDFEGRSGHGLELPAQSRARELLDDRAARLADAARDGGAARAGRRRLADLRRASPGRSARAHRDAHRLCAGARRRRGGAGSLPGAATTATSSACAAPAPVARCSCARPSARTSRR